MPILEFKCPYCDWEEEHLTFHPETFTCICSQCNAEMERQISSSNFKVNGHNYKNGYNNANKNKYSKGN